MERFIRNKVHVDSHGRVVIPANMRRAMKIGPGETLIASVKNGQLVLEKPENMLGRLKATFSDVPSGISLADELIAERREEALREAEGG